MGQDFWNFSWAEEAHNVLNLVFDDINILISGYRPDQPRHIQLHSFAVSKVPLNSFEHLMLVSRVFVCLFLWKGSSTLKLR